MSATPGSSKSTLQLPQKPLTLLERIESRPAALQAVVQQPEPLRVGNATLPGPVSHWQNNAKDIKGKSRSLRIDEDYEGDLQAPWYDADFEGRANLENWSRSRRLHEEMVAFINYIESTPEEREARRLLTSSIREIIQLRWHGATVLSFGSVTTGLELPSADIDLTVELDEVQDRQAIVRTLRTLRKIIDSYHIMQFSEVVAHAKVPVLSFITIDTLGSLRVDISFRSEDDAGLKAIPIVKDYLNRMPALRPLILFTKAFLEQRNLNSAALGSLSSYNTINMCISFLQLNPGKRPIEFVEHHIEQKSLGILLIDFLDYYANHFPYATHAISVIEGKLLSKEEKNWIPKNNVETLSIQCLINHDRDVGRSCGKLQAIKDAFKTGHQSLESEWTSGSLLKRVIGIPKELINERTELAKLVNRGEFTQQTVRNASYIRSSVRPPPYRNNAVPVAFQDHRLGASRGSGYRGEQRSRHYNTHPYRR